MENPYSKHPLKVVFIDPRKWTAVRTYVLVGAIPKSIVDAARKAGKWAAEKAATERAFSDAEILSGFYGTDWRATLAPLEAPNMDEYVLGGAEAASGGAGEFGDLGDFDRIDDELPSTEGQTAPVRTGRKIQVPDSGPLIYSDVAVYPEDTIWDLRLKIFAASGVPPYRQHLLYTTGDGTLRLPYRIHLQGAPVLSDIHDLYSEPSGAAAEEQSLVAGMPVDRRFEEQKDNITVEALDTFQLLQVGQGSHVTAAYVIDLYSVVSPVSEGSVQRRTELSAALQDKYQFDLLYYGGVVRFWPQMSADAFQLAVTDSDSLTAAYPLLAPDLDALKARLNLEKAIAERVHAYHVPRDPRMRPSIAVTAAEIRVTPEGLQTRASPRNLFDLVPTSIRIPAIVARFDLVDPFLGTISSVAVSRRHISSYMPRVASIMDRFSARAPKRPAIEFAVMRSTAGEDAAPAEPGRQSSIAFMTVNEDARYSVMSDWREDDRVSFEMAQKDLSGLTSPLIDAINATGPASLPFGGSLAEITESKTSRFGSITVSAFWPHAVTSEGFRRIKDRWRDYERAGIIGIKGLQQAGAYVLQFRKGIVGYDPSAIERMAIRRIAVAASSQSQNPAGTGGPPAEETISVANRYSYLTDINVLARWNTLYGGRIVRLFHRATDIRIEVMGADGLDEFNIIRQYMFAFLDGLLQGPGKIEGLQMERHALPKGEEETLHGPGSRRLRRLQEKDPNLYDLKKYNESATVYSVLCQAGRQPHIYNEDEITALPPKRRASLVKYWNFTEDRPAYYECPSTQFPFLSFRAGQHPLGWCLPCCKKTRPAKGSRAELINEECLRSHKRVLATEEEAVSRHVLSYGKIVPVGRVSELAKSVADGILHDALPRPYALKMVGVPQTTPGIPEAGFMYSVAASVADEGEGFNDVVSRLAKACRDMGDSFALLGGGAATVFATASDLADSIVKTLVELSADLSPLGPGGAAGSTWRDIIRDLVRAAYGVEIITLVDKAADGDVIIEASPETIEAFFPTGNMPDHPELRVAIISSVGGASATGSLGTYPVFAMDPKTFLRAPTAGRASQARRTFSSAEMPSNLQDTIIPVADHVVNMLKDVLSLAGPSPGLVLDMRFILSACASAKKEFSVVGKLANLRGKCYGVLIAKAGERETGNARQPFFFPTRESPCTADGIPVTFGARPKAAAPKSDILGFLGMLNAYASSTAEQSKEMGKQIFEPVATLIDPAAGEVGLALGDPAGSFLLCYYTPIPATGSSTMPAINIPYDTQEVDSAIADSRGGQAIGNALTPSAAMSAYLNRLYRLFVAEFAAAMREERNSTVRKQLAAIVKGTHFDSPGDVSRLRAKLAAALKLYPEDLDAVQAIISREMSQPSHNISQAIDRAITASSFGFDYLTLKEMRAKSHDQVVAAVKKIMEPRIEILSGKAIDPPGNIFTACTVDSSVERPQCYGGKLLVPSDKIDTLIDILSSDVKNTQKMIALSMAAGIFDEYGFIERSGETFRVIDAPWL